MKFAHPSANTSMKLFEFGILQRTGNFNLCYCTPWINQDKPDRFHCSRLEEHRCARCVRAL